MSTTTDPKMRFRQLDRITEIKAGEKIEAILTLSGNEDYLRDHFPLFKVMPGVLMLEALFQASCWLIRSTDNFKDSILILKEARNVKFADFMEPGHELKITAEIVKSDDQTVTLKAVGTKGELTALSARLIIGKSSLADNDPSLFFQDEFMRRSMRTEMNRLLAAR